MIEIRPFKGILFNKNKIKDISKVFCPPYDVILPEEQDRYYHLSPYNMVRLVLNKGSLDENLAGNRYDNALKEFKEWQHKRILIRDEKPAFYLYEQEFTFNSRKFVRLGIFAVLRLSDSNSYIFPHEYTHSAPKIDRLKLIMKVKANLSPIFCIFSDKDNMIERIAGSYKGKQPLFDFVDGENIRQRFWRVDDKGIIFKLKKYLKDKEFFIADGHHRFEVACQYRNLMKSKSKKSDKDAPYNFVMVYLADADSSQNLILAYHRVVAKKDIEKEELLDYIKRCFTFKTMKNRKDLFKFLQANKKASGVYGLYFKREIYGLRLKKTPVLNQDLFSEYSQAMKKLDVVILQGLILDNLSLKEGEVIYTKDESEAFELVDSGLAEFAIFLNPTRVSQLRKVVSLGLRMPQKSTYFYPKVLSGLVINKLS